VKHQELLKILDVFALERKGSAVKENPYILKEANFIE
jgi:hypothetical protein